MNSLIIAGDPTAAGHSGVGRREPKDGQEGLELGHHPAGFGGSGSVLNTNCAWIAWAAEH